VLAGGIVSMSLAMGGVTRMRTRGIYAAVGHRETRRDCDKRMWLTAEAIKEIEFWLDHFDEFDGMPFDDPRGEVTADVSGANDAGDDGYGGYLKVENT
jgi:hypothetical protein